MRPGNVSVDSMEDDDSRAVRHVRFSDVSSDAEAGRPNPSNPTTRRKRRQFADSDTGSDDDVGSDVGFEINPDGKGFREVVESGVGARRPPSRPTSSGSEMDSPSSSKAAKKKTTKPRRNLFMTKGTACQDARRRGKSGQPSPTSGASPSGRRSAASDSEAEEPTVKAGKRLHALAKASQQRQRDAIAAQRLTSEGPLSAEYTFRPEISRFSSDLADVSGYRPPHERRTAADLMASDARRLQQQFERREANEARLMADCTFRPKLAEKSAELVTRQRAGSVEHRHVDPGNRLYDQGQLSARLQRQALREHEAAHQRDVVGGRYVSAAHAAEYADRLHSWGQKRDALLEQLREEVARSDGHPTILGAAERSRSVQRLHNGRVSSTPGSDSEDAIAERAEQRRRAIHAEATAEETHAPRVSAVSAHLATSAKTHRYERIFERFAGAAEDVSVAQIRGLVRNAFNKDAGILSVFRHDTDEKRYTREEMVAALEVFERQYGPQPWERAERPASPKHTFRPLLSARSQAIVAARRRDDYEAAPSATASESSAGLREHAHGRTQGPNNSTATTTRLYNLGVAQQRARSAPRPDVQAPPDPECTFAPRITQRSKQLSDRQLMQAAVGGLHAHRQRRVASRGHSGARGASPPYPSPTRGSLDDGAVSPLSDTDHHHHRRIASAASPPGAAVHSPRHAHLPSPRQLAAARLSPSTNRSGGRHGAAVDDILRDIDVALQRGRESSARQRAEAIGLNATGALRGSGSSDHQRIRLGHGAANISLSTIDADEESCAALASTARPGSSQQGPHKKIPIERSLEGDSIAAVLDKITSSAYESALKESHLSVFNAGVALHVNNSEQKKKQQAATAAAAGRVVHRRVPAERELVLGPSERRTRAFGL